MCHQYLYIYIYSESAFPTLSNDVYHNPGGIQISQITVAALLNALLNDESGLQDGFAKAGDSAQLKNFRPISLLNSDY